MKTSGLSTNLKWLVASITTTALLPLSSFGGPAVLDTAINPANGHVYYLFDRSDWTSAENAAIALGGHLATIRNVTENTWVLNRWGTNGRSLWIGLHDPVVGDGSGAQHAADFVWSSGETSAYRNWTSGEPNNANGLEYCAVIAGNGQWNDLQDYTNYAAAGNLQGVAEVSVCTPHHATATAVLTGQFVTSATVTDSGCGYTNAPQVTITNGGGFGATATASVTNGVVTAVNITATGSGYTNAPQIIIASPPFVPTLGIKFSAVKVTQHLRLGVNYQLQSSSDLVNWAATGPVFTATNEYMVNEFELDITGQYFRILEMP
jgi:hypothetical protein